MSQQPEVSAKQTRLLPKSHEASSRLVSFIAELAGNMVMDVLEVNQLIKYKARVYICTYSPKTKNLSLLPFHTYIFIFFPSFLLFTKLFSSFFP